MTTFDKIKTAAIARLEAGENLEHILQDYADYEDDLRPILEEIAGGSLGHLVRTPKSAEKPKVKSKRNTTNWQMPAIVAGILAILFAGVLLAAFTIQKNDTPTINIVNIEPTTIEPTDIALVDPIIHQTVTDACASLDQQRITTTYEQNQQVSQSNSGEVIVESVEVYPESAELALATPSPAPTMPPETGMGGGGDTSTSAGMTSAPADGMAVVSADESIVVTSVASYSEVDKVEEEAPSLYLGDVADDADYGADMETRSEGAPGRSGTIASEPVMNQVVLELLRAGEIDDNADWDTYQEYRRNYLNQYGTYSVRDVDTTDRQVINVVDSNGLPVLGACVEVYKGEYFVAASRTYATGLTLFFPNLRDETRYAETFRVVVSKGQVSAEETMERDNIGGVTTVELNMNQEQGTIPLDVLFLLDATGSMSDEIAQLQENILAISAKVDALDANIDVRYSLVIYRDRGDDYVTRIYDFTDNVAAFQKLLSAVQAGGGGDYPESMNEGLDMALNAVAWRGEDAMKLVFLVADAPPHIDYPNDADYSLLMQDAMARGIKIHPIASSGLQPEGEFIMRQIGQFTMGHFIFLTYEDGVAGTAGDDRPDLDVGEAKDEQGVGDYDVSQLDELVLRLITDEIHALSGE